MSARVTLALAAALPVSARSDADTARNNPAGQPDGVVYPIGDAASASAPLSS
jgi:hypothetical protein